VLLALAIGRRHFAMPFPIARMAKVLAASVALWRFLQLDFGNGGQALAVAGNRRSRGLSYGPADAVAGHA
jgi:hypothetical protein